MFDIDPTRYRIIDISYDLAPPGFKSQGKPFEPKAGTLPDRAFKHTVTMDTHTGTHVEYPVHFVETGRRPEDYTLADHMGRALVVDVNSVSPEPVEPDVLEEQVGALVRAGDILIFRNVHPAAAEVAARNPAELPYLGLGAAEWIMARKVKLVMISTGCHVRLARDLEYSREIHDILMGGDDAIPLVEVGAGLEQISRKEVFFMAVPFRARGVDSLWARVLVIEEI